jgi:penicillin-binding protein 1B
MLKFSNAVEKIRQFIHTLSKKGMLKNIRITYKVTWNLFLVFLVFIMMGTFFAGGVGAGYFASLVKNEPIRSYDTMKKDIYNYEETSEMFFSDNQLLGKFRSDIDREEISLDDISLYAQQAVVATEDSYFYEHDGIVPKAIGRAVLQEVSNSAVQTGGSTLTQQLVKNQILTSEVSFERKAKEMLLALRLERFFSKNEILEAYLNVVPFGRNSSGRNIAGIEAAAKGVFNVSAIDLTLPQAAFLAGLPQSPYGYTPFNQDGTKKDSIEPALNRMQIVLSRMLSEGYITNKQYEEAISYNIEADFAEPKPSPQEQYPYLTFEVERRAINTLAKHLADEEGYNSTELETNHNHYYNALYEHRVTSKSLESIAQRENFDLAKIEKDYHVFNGFLGQADKDIRRNGYQIHTTIDKAIYDSMQTAKNSVLDDWRYFESPRTLKVTDPETGEKVEKMYPMEVGAMLIENSTGKIISFIGGTDYEQTQLNHATQAYRPNGSTMKPLLDYAPAMEEGKVQPGYILVDSPLDEVKGWNPQNYTGRFYGLVTAREALKKSHNIPAIRTFLRMDPYKATSYLEKMGFTSLMGSDRTNYSMSIGALTRGVTVEENTNAYATFANSGKFVDSYMIDKIISKDGEVIYQQEVQPRDVFSPQTAYLTIDMMRDVIYGGGTAARVPSYLKFQSDWAGKTGTTQNWEDAWLVATNPNVTLGVWTGFDKPMRMDTSNYASRNQRLWALFANAAYDERPQLMDPDERFKMPSGIVRRSICGISGLLASDLCREAGLVKTDLFNVKFVPTKSDDSLVTSRYVVINGKNYRALDTTPEEFTQQGVTVKKDYFTGYDNIENLVPDNLEQIDVLAQQKAQENGKQPNSVLGLTINEGTLSWSQHKENDIVGYRIYRAADESSKFIKVGSVATFDETTSFSIGNKVSAYYVTAVDAAGKESGRSKIVKVGEWSNKSKPDEKSKDEQTSTDDEKPKDDDKPKNENESTNTSEQSKPSSNTTSSSSTNNSNFDTQ